MRAIGTPKLLSWRWAPCVALVAGASCFAAFAMLVIPEQIGDAPATSSASAAFRTNIDSSVPTDSGSSSRFSNADSGPRSSAAFSSLPSNGAGRVVATNAFPKRGFTPPLERPDPPPAPPPAVPPQPALDVQAPVAVPVPPPPDAPPPQDAQSASLGMDQARPTD